MRIDKNTLPDLEKRDVFSGTYIGYVVETLGHARLFPKFAAQRVIEAHGAWLSDLRRVGDHEPQLDDGLDHFKRCGHLAFWIRRMSPMVEVIDLTENVADAPGHPVTDAENAFRDLLFGYANEYLAFDFGFQICKFYEMYKPGGSVRASNFTPSMEYIQGTCQFLKYKTVSPHAMFLIYKSLFAA